MDRRSLNKIDEPAELFNSMMYRVNTCLPGIVVSFDVSDGVPKATVRPAIQMRTVVDGVPSFETLPDIDEVPVLMLGGAGDFVITHPVKPGMSCLLFFSQRCIDNWYENGGVQPPEDGVESRKHDLTDAFCLVGPISIPEAISDVDTDGMVIRSRTGDTKIKVTNTQVTTTAGGVTLTVDATGAKSSSDISDSKGTLDALRQAYNTHVHSGVTTGPGNSGPPSVTV